MGVSIFDTTGVSLVLGDVSSIWEVEIGDETLTKTPSVIEQIAYRDTWKTGADSFLSMIYERIILMRDLLSDDGALYLHIDHRTEHYIRLILEEVFGKDNYLNDRKQVFL